MMLIIFQLLSNVVNVVKYQRSIVRKHSRYKIFFALPYYWQLWTTIFYFSSLKEILLIKCVSFGALGFCFWTKLLIFCKLKKNIIHMVSSTHLAWCQLFSKIGHELVHKITRCFEVADYCWTVNFVIFYFR